MHLYKYCGPVMIFGTCVDRTWIATTWAASEKKARSNFAYRYKRETNRALGSKIELPGKIELLQ